MNIKETYFIIFRHGDTKFNGQGRFQGNGYDLSLCASGITQAYSLSKSLEKTKIEIIAASPLKRAFETGSIVAANKNIKIIKDKRLQEINLGTASGKLKKDVPELSKYFDWKNLDFAFPDGESKRAMQERFIYSLKEMGKWDEKYIGIATHGSLIAGLFAYFQYYVDFNIPMAVPIIVKLRNNKLELLTDFIELKNQYGMD